jgi:hypothetical protein
LNFESLALASLALQIYSNLISEIINDCNTYDVYEISLDYKLTFCISGAIVFEVNRNVLENKITVEMRILKINYASISPHQSLIFGYVEDLSIMIILYG